MRAALACGTSSLVADLTGGNAITLRDYQEKGVSLIRRAFSEKYRSPLLVLPTGGGKTIIFVFITHGARAKGKKVLIVVHRIELLQQAVAKLNLAGVSCGIIAAGIEPDYSQAIQVGSIQTIVRRLDKLPDFDLFVLDEGHHARAGQWTKLLKAVMDHVSNSIEHGLPTKRIKWSPSGKSKRRTEEKEPEPWQCPQCGCLNSPGTIACEECGLIRSGEKRQETPINGSGDLAELTPEIMARIRVTPYREFIAVPRSYVELKMYADHHGYQRGWIKHVQREQAAQRGDSV
jgi:Type III restriction enzyme, res subunit